MFNSFVIYDCKRFNFNGIRICKLVIDFKCMYSGRSSQSLALWDWEIEEL